MKSNVLLTLFTQAFVNKVHLKPWVYNVLALVLILLTYGADILSPMIGISTSAVAIISQLVSILISQKPQDLIDAPKKDIISDDAAYDDISGGN